MHLLEALDHDLPMRPEANDWYPTWVQLRLTELIIERHLAGEASALIPLIWEDAAHTAGPIAATALRLLGPVRILSRTPGSFTAFYDNVAANAEFEEGFIRVDYSGPELVDHPTWQFLQALSLTGILQIGGHTTWNLVATAPGPGRYQLSLTL
jgi:hypothetical protein